MSAITDVKRKIQGFLWQLWYNFLSGRFAPDTGRNWAFMNYAYVPKDPKDMIKASSPEEEKDLANMMLYYNTAKPDKVQWSGKNVLEVGSGRGGGAAFLASRLKPKSYIALDYAETSITTSKKYHAHVKDLSFVHGDAMALPFEKESFDIVMNVESSHVYPDFPKFLSEVHRVLKPDGSFCWTDFRRVEKWADIEAKLKAAGFVGEIEDITSDVVRGLDATAKEREILIDHLCDWNLPVLSSLGALTRKIVKDFAGTPGSPSYRKFSERSTTYRAAVFKKKA